MVNSTRTVSDTKTENIRVQTESFFLPDRSNISDPYFFFAYRIRITNEGGEPARLVSRHWIITDSLGHVEEVRGPGVVGEQPRLEPGQSHEYTSSCPLHTQFGTMSGAYRMERDDGSFFEAEIGEFLLCARPLLS